MNVKNAKPPFVFILIVLMLLTGLLIFNENLMYHHIDINNLNVINMYFASSQNESPQNRSKTGQPSAQYNVYNKTGTRYSANSADTPDLKGVQDILIPGDQAHIHRKLKFSSPVGNQTATRKLIESEMDIHEDARRSEYDVRRKNKREVYFEDICVKRFPKCVIIGIQKCGTKAVAEFLKIHPNISIDSRQTYFFSQQYNKGLEWYRNRMPCSQNSQITLERTPQYFYFKDVPRRIFDMNKLVKVILLVCDPVTRAISNFAMAKDRNRAESSDTFEDCVLTNNNRSQINTSCKYIKKSNYQRYISEWLKVFPLNQIHIANGDGLIKDPVDVLIQIEKFLNIPAFIKENNFVVNQETGFKCIRNITSNGMECLSRKKGRRHPIVKDDVLLMLKQYFKPLNHKFFEMVGQTFDW